MLTAAHARHRAAAALARRARGLLAQGAALFAEGQKANEHGDNFTLVTVLFTMVLFFGGMASVLDRI